MPKKKLPDIASEAEEALWYSRHRDELDDYFDEVPEMEAESVLAALPPRDVAIRQAKTASKAHQVRSVSTSIRLSSEDIAAAKKIAARKGLKYQTWIKSVVHQAIEAESVQGRK